MSTPNGSQDVLALLLPADIEGEARLLATRHVLVPMSGTVRPQEHEVKASHGHQGLRRRAVVRQLGVIRPRPLALCRPPNYEAASQNHAGLFVLCSWQGAILRGFEAVPRHPLARL